jgi:alanine racemase
MRFRSRLVVDLAQLGTNVSLLKEQYDHHQILFMVKADAYGHGMVSIVRYAVCELAIKEFGCATIGEALTLRTELPDLEFDIYVFSDVQIELQVCTELYLHRRIIPVISNRQDLEFLLEHNDFRHFPLILKFNTGMNRLGINDDQVSDVIRMIKKSGRSSIYHLMTHFATADEDLAQHTLGIKQQNVFENLVREFQTQGIQIERTSRANSGALEQLAGFQDSHIRPGLLLYGPHSVKPDLREKSWWRGQLLSQLETYIINVFKVKKGDTIGYGATHVQNDGVIAVIALGYGDGFSTRYQGVTLKHAGHNGVVMGRVNMDMAQVFFPLQAFEDLKVGEKFVIWNHEVEPFMNLAQQSQTLTYELFCQLSSRVPRIHQLRT